MAIITKDNFDFIDDITGNPEAIILKGEDLAEEIRYIIDNKITSIYLTHFKSKAIANLDFLKEINFIEKININDLDIDYSGLYHLDGLKKAILSIKNKKQYLDYSRFKNLVDLSLDWYPQFPNFSKNKKLKFLTIWKYKPQSKNFIGLVGLAELQFLKITQSNIESIKGIETLNNLLEFQGYYLPKLKSLHGIELLSKSLKILVLEKCKNLMKYQSDLEVLNRLEKLILTDCGELNNLEFINKLNNLKFFTFFNTTVKGGDLSPLRRRKFEYLGFDDKKNYSDKLNALANRGIFK